MDSSEESPLKFKVMKRGLRVTSTDPPKEFMLDFRLWDAIASSEEVNRWPATSAHHAYLVKVEGSRVWARGLARMCGGPGYYLSWIGERVRAQMPPPPPLADRPPPLKGKARKVRAPTLDLRDIELLRSWPSEVVRAIPVGGKECVEDTWARPAGLLRLSNLFQLGMVEVGVAHIAWDMQTSRAIPGDRKAPRVVWRRTAEAKLAFS